MFIQGIMMTHVVLGVVGIMFAVALFVDVLNVREGNIERIKKLSLAVCSRLYCRGILVCGLLRPRQGYHKGRSMAVGT